jgi:hypothetical protein
LPFLHPIEAKSRRAELEAVQIVHPGSLLWDGNFSEADEGDARTTTDKPSDEFTGVFPNTA